MNESTEQIPPFNPSGAMPVSGMILASQMPSNGLTPGSWYWITYPYKKTYVSWSGNSFVNHSESTELKKCQATNSEDGLFDTDELGLSWIHYTRCVSAPTPKESNGFFARFFGR